MSIKKDLESGSLAEQMVIDFFVSVGFQAKKNNIYKDKSFYDIVLNDAITVEVKNDLYSLKSGNIAIEVFNPKINKESGLSITKSDLWIIICGEEIWVEKTQVLKSFINKYTPYRIISAGGDNNATLLLYKKELIFNEIFIRIDKKTSNEIHEIINDKFSKKDF